MHEKLKTSLKWSAVLTTVILPVSLVLADTSAVPMKAGAGQPANTSMTGIHQGDIHAIEDITTLETDEMRLHMDGARLADSGKDYKVAADELRKVQAHVQSQLTALQNANNRLAQLITDTQNGKVTPTELDQAFVQVRHATNRMQNWVPIASEEVDVFMPEMDYHLALAKQEWQAGKHRTAAKDVRRAVSYLRLRQDALPANKTERREALQKAEKNLSKLATEIQNGKSLSAKQIDDGFGEAAAAWNGSF